MILYRNPTGYKHDRGQTVGDVVRYEMEELGNSIGALEGKNCELPASFVAWFTLGPAEASRYGNDVVCYDIEPATVLGFDSDWGVLILSDHPIQT